MKSSRTRPRLTSPLLPNGVDVLISPPPYDACSFIDKFLVYASSLIVVGSPLWFYGGIIYLYRKWKQYRALALLLSKDGNHVVVDENNHTTSSAGESSQERPRPDHESIQRYNRYKKLATRYGAALTMLLGECTAYDMNDMVLLSAIFL